MTLCNHSIRVEIVLVPAEWQPFLSTEKDMKAVFLVMFLKRGGQWGDVCAYLRFMKSGCPVLASLLCGSVISSQLLAALL